MSTSPATIRLNSPQRLTNEPDEDFWLRVLEYWDCKSYRKYAPPDIQRLLRERDDLMLEDMRKARETIMSFHSASQDVMAHIAKVVAEVKDGIRSDKDHLYISIVKGMLDYQRSIETENQRHQNVLAQDRQRIQGQKELVEMQSGEHRVSEGTVIEVKYNRPPQPKTPDPTLIDSPNKEH